MKATRYLGRFLSWRCTFYARSATFARYSNWLRETLMNPRAHSNRFFNRPLPELSLLDLLRLASSLHDQLKFITRFIHLVEPVILIGCIGLLTYTASNAFTPSFTLKRAAGCVIGSFSLYTQLQTIKQQKNKYAEEYQLIKREFIRRKMKRIDALQSAAATQKTNGLSLKKL